MAIGINFVLGPLETEPFHQVALRAIAVVKTLCSAEVQGKEKKVAVVTWNWPLTDLLGQKAAIRFHIVKGDDPFLLGSNVISASKLVGAEKSLLIPKMLSPQ